MRRPFRHCCYQVAEKLGWSLQQVQTTMTASQVYEWMAYFMTQNQDFRDQYKVDNETADEAMMEVFGG